MRARRFSSIGRICGMCENIEIAIEDSPQRAGGDLGRRNSLIDEGAHLRSAGGRRLRYRSGRRGEFGWRVALAVGNAGVYAEEVDDRETCNQRTREELRAAEAQRERAGADGPFLVCLAELRIEIAHIICKSQRRCCDRRGKAPEESRSSLS